MVYSLIKIGLFDYDIKRRLRRISKRIAQKLRICSLVLQSLYSFLYTSAQPRIHSYSSKVNRELDLQGYRIIPVNILLPHLHSVLITH